MESLWGTCQYFASTAGPLAESSGVGPDRKMGLLDMVLCPMQDLIVPASHSCPLMLNRRHSGLIDHIQLLIGWVSDA